MLLFTIRRLKKKTFPKWERANFLRRITISLIALDYIIIRFRFKQGMLIQINIKISASFALLCWCCTLSKKILSFKLYSGIHHLFKISCPHTCRSIHISWLFYWSIDLCLLIYLSGCIFSPLIYMSLWLTSMYCKQCTVGYCLFNLIWQPLPLIRVVVVQLLSCVQLFETPWTAAHQVSLSFIISWIPLKLMSVESVMPSRNFILCCPLLLSPSVFPSIRVFPNSQLLRYVTNYLYYDHCS